MSDPDLLSAIRELNATVAKISNDMKYYATVRYSATRAFLKGLVYTMGALSAVAIVIPTLLWLLQGVGWPPKVAHFIDRVIMQLEERRNLRAKAGDQ